MGKMHIIGLKKDQDVMAGLHEYMKDKDWKRAYIVGAVGTVYDVTVGNPGPDYGTPAYKGTETKFFGGPAEVVSMMGEIYRKEDYSYVPAASKEPVSGYMIHIHMTFSHGADCLVNGGGYRQATVLRALNVYVEEVDGD